MLQQLAYVTASTNTAGKLTVTGLQTWNAQVEWPLGEATVVAISLGSRYYN